MGYSLDLNDVSLQSASQLSSGSYTLILAKLRYTLHLALPFAWDPSSYIFRRALVPESSLLKFCMDQSRTKAPVQFW